MENTKIKIAVQLHGESRTWEKVAPSIQKFFNLGDQYDVHFFGHTWSRNSWKKFDKVHQGSYVHEDLDKNKLFNNISCVYNFSNLRIDTPYINPDQHIKKEINKVETSSFEFAANHKKPSAWNSMSYSAMVCNFLRQEYEIQNDIKFDIVVSTRFDCCFTPEYNFLHYKPAHVEQNILYTEVTFHYREFMQHMVNDVFYFGKPETLDIVDNLYRVYHNGHIFEMYKSGYFDGWIKNVGYGVLLYKWCVLKNIHPSHIGDLPWAILREGTQVTDINNQYDLAVKEAFVWGKIEQ